MFFWSHGGFTYRAHTVYYKRELGQKIYMCLGLHAQENYGR